MSWDQYVTNMESEGCRYAGLFGKDGNPWAQSKDPCLQVDAASVQALVSGLSTKSPELDPGRSTKMAGQKFMVLRKTEGESVTLKRMTQEESEKMMVHVSLTCTGICVGASSGANEKKCIGVVDRYVIYLKDQSY